MRFLIEQAYLDKIKFEHVNDGRMNLFMDTSLIHTAAIIID